MDSLSLLKLQLTEQQTVDPGPRRSRLLSLNSGALQLGGEAEAAQAAAAAPQPKRKLPPGTHPLPGLLRCFLGAQVVD